MVLIHVDFTLSNAKQFYSTMGKPSGVEGLNSQKKNQQQHGKQQTNQPPAECHQ